MEEQQEKSLDTVEEISTTSSPPVESSGSSELRRLRNRIIAGLFVILPLYITWVVVKWLYELLYDYAMGPIAYGLREVLFQGEKGYYLEVVSGVLAFFVVLAILMIAGVFAKSRLLRFTNWLLNKVPGVNMVYRVVSNVFEAISASQNTQDFKRVVLVSFPHPGMKVPAFVTSECTDEKTGNTILCIYVPTTPVPTSGYMLLVPEEDVIPLDWGLEETLQAIVSGGITVPKKVAWHQAA